MGRIEGGPVGAEDGLIVGSGVGFHSHSLGSLIVDIAHLPSAHAVQKREVILPAKEHAAHSSGASMFLFGHSYPTGHGLQPVAT